MISESIWKKEKSFLEEDASNISTLKKEITKQTEIDASVQSSINEKIDNLKNNATFLAKKLQNQKHKNAELQLIIKHMRSKMEQQRLQSASFRDNVNTEDLNSLDNRFKKLQYDLGQINGKVNRMSQNVEQKKHKISQNRTQRVIDSGIFRNIEKQLINSQLTFKKLLIEKIKYQKEYDKIIQDYNSLKEKAQNYYCQKDTSRTKTNKDLHNLSEVEAANEVYKKKFLEVEMMRSNVRKSSYCKVDEQIDREEDKQIMCIKKMMINTNLETSQDLLHYFKNIEQINDKYFNQINIYADQSNEIQKYLEEVAATKKHKKTNFSNEKLHLSKQEQTALDYNDKQTKLQTIKSEINEQTSDIASFVNSQAFNILLKDLEIEPSKFVEEGHANFDSLQETLRLFDSRISQFLREPMKIEEEEKTSTARNTAGPEKLEEIINKVRKNDQCFKVMKKQEFKDEYKKLVKNMSQKAVAGRSVNKKKSFPVIKK